MCTSPLISSPGIPKTSTSMRCSGEGGEENVRVPAGTALVAAEQILALATEGLNMMRNVTGVMKDNSLDRAKAYVVFTFLLLINLYSRWVGRLVIQRDKQVKH